MDSLKLLKYALAALVIGAIGFLAGSRYSPVSKQSNLPNQSNTPTQQENVFKEQNGVIEGKVTKAEGTLLTIESNSGGAGTFSLSPQAVVYKTMNNEQIATPSSGLNSVELNKPAFIFLKLANNQYEITTINYIAAQARAEALPPAPQQPLKK